MEYNVLIDYVPDIMQALHFFFYTSKLYFDTK